MRKIPLMFKLVGLISVLMISLTGILAFISWRHGYKSLEERFGLVLKHIAINTALQIDGTEQAQIVSKKDANSQAFRKIHSMLQKAMKANFLTPETFYTFNIDANHALKFAVMLHEKKFVSDAYSPPAVNRHHFESVMNGASVFTGIYSDDHGMWISGLAPIMVSGRVIGIVEADFRIEQFVSELRAQTIQIVESSGIILLLAILLAILLARRITTPIKDLNIAAAAITQGVSRGPLIIRTHDEIGELQNSFNEMLQSINERYMMLKYLSPHTKRMIEEEIRNPQLSTGQIRNVVLLFSDVRGFTKYSATRDPRDVIHNLNALLGKQAEIIESYGGDIDKFVGDEIIAIFEGEDAELLAMKSAVAILKMIEANRITSVFDSELSVGIGIASGEVVMGNIGSAGRQDFTVIGSNVNLAARICSAAVKDEILMSSHVYYALSEGANDAHRASFAIRKKGMLRAKGFADPIPVYQFIPDEKMESSSGLAKAENGV